MKSWYAPLLLFVIIHCALLYAIDLRDLPGAGGTETVYKASIGERKGDITVWILQWISHYADVGPQHASRILSSLCGLVSVFSMMLAARAYTTRAAIVAGWMGATWVMNHYFALMTGSDPVSHSLAWLSIGLCWWGAANLPFRGTIALLLGAILASIAVQTKELALPPLFLLLCTPFWIRRWNLQLLWITPLVLYSSYWGFAWFWPQNPTRLAISTIDLQALFSGWGRLLDLYTRGIPQGKFDQLLLLSLLLLPFGLYHRKKRLLIWICGAGIVLFTAYSLGPRTRPRYITPAMLGVFLSLSISITMWNRQWKKILLAICLLFVLDTWAFFDVWSEKRERIVGGKENRIPTSLRWWRQQFQDSSDITHRDLSMYGAIDLYTIIDTNPKIAMMRLRDERHRSLLAFSAILGKEAIILDPGACCAGNPVDENCADTVITQARKIGYVVVLPILFEGVERIYPNETRWHQLLLQNQKKWNTDHFWYAIPADIVQEVADPPCTHSIPFRAPK